ncbi:hypothetical protein [Candidatus Chordibacter forsetii]|uniref:hypothetical protein n=1 Tax=Candidatus Chordibacter forsetii TaxID=3381758 RepID=UPI0023134A76|nr:hypothetical protein [Opitutales bacterium]MDB3958472.1 hypothetical protein [Opitutales bacterium]
MESSSDEEELSEVQKRILAKNKVLQEIADHKTKLRLLKKKYKEGHNVSQDIDGAEGYVEVLKKELISIQEGSHSTFLAAKKIISPKFNVDTKKGKILSNIRTLAKDIRECEAFLSGGDRTREENEDVRKKLEVLRADHAEAQQELKALSQFNHTRFLEMKEAQQELTENEDVAVENISDVPEAVESLTPGVKPKPTETMTDFNPPPMI